MSADMVLLVLGGVAIAAGAVVVFGRNLLHNVMAFTVVLLASAGLFAAMGSDFLAIVQIFVYVGGVVVLMLFGLMFTASSPGAPVRVDSRHTVVGAVAALGLAAMAIPALARISGIARPDTAGSGSAAAIGTQLLTDYALAFEVVGFVLLAAAVAAIVIVRRGEAR